jgi:hypothetical protein
MRRDLVVVPEGTTEDKLIELWVRLKKSEHTRRAYRRDVQFFSDFVEKPLAEVTLEDALDFCESLDELETTNRGGEKKPLEDNSKRRIINSVKSLYSFAYSSGLFPANVMAAIKPPSAKSAISRRILSEATVLKMIVLEQDPRNHAILHVLYAAGLRVSELCNLRWRHVIRRVNGVQLDIMSGKGDNMRFPPTGCGIATVPTLSITRRHSPSFAGDTGRFQIIQRQMGNNRGQIRLQGNDLRADPRLIAQIGLLHQILRVTRAARHSIGNGKEQHTIVLKRFCLVPLIHGFVHRSSFSFSLIVSPYQDRKQPEGCHICPCSLVFCTSLSRERHAKHRETREEIVCNIFW